MTDFATRRARAELAGRVKRGEDVVDEHAVADALLAHWRREGLPVLVSPEPLEPPPVLGDEDQPTPGDDAA